MGLKVTWEVTESEPAAPVFSATHTIICSRVTTTNQCFVSWNTDFSSDATPAVIEDSKWKKDDAFKQLSSFVGKASYRFSFVCDNDAQCRARKRYQDKLS